MEPTTRIPPMMVPPISISEKYATYTRNSLDDEYLRALPKRVFNKIDVTAMLDTDKMEQNYTYFPEGQHPPPSLRDILHRHWDDAPVPEVFLWEPIYTELKGEDNEGLAGVVTSNGSPRNVSYTTSTRPISAAQDLTGLEDRAKWIDSGEEWVRGVNRTFQRAAAVDREWRSYLTNIREDRLGITQVSSCAGNSSEEMDNAIESLVHDLNNSMTSQKEINPSEMKSGAVENVSGETPSDILLEPSHHTALRLARRMKSEIDQFGRPSEAFSRDLTLYYLQCCIGLPKSVHIWLPFINPDTLPLINERSPNTGAITRFHVLYKTLMKLNDLHSEWYTKQCNLAPLGDFVNETPSVDSQPTQPMSLTQTQTTSTSATTTSTPQTLNSQATDANIVSATPFKDFRYLRHPSGSRSIKPLSVLPIHVLPEGEHDVVLRVANPELLPLRRMLQGSAFAAIERAAVGGGTLLEMFTSQTEESEEPISNEAAEFEQSAISDSVTGAATPGMIETHTVRSMRLFESHTVVKPMPLHERVRYMAMAPSPEGKSMLAWNVGSAAEVSHFTNQEARDMVRTLVLE